MTPTTTPTEPTQGPPRESDETDRNQPLTSLRTLIDAAFGMAASARKTMLERLGCNDVGIALRVPEAEEFACYEQFDGVLLDLNHSGAYSFAGSDIPHERNMRFINPAR